MLGITEAMPYAAPNDTIVGSLTQFFVCGLLGHGATEVLGVGRANDMQLETPDGRKITLRTKPWIL